MAEKRSLIAVGCRGQLHRESASIYFVITSNKKHGGVILGTSLWLKDEKRYVFVNHVDHTPRSGGEAEMEGEHWRVVEWTDRIKCELLRN